MRTGICVALLTACLAGGAAAQAQTAKVIALTPEEARQAKSLTEQKAEIERKMKALEVSVRKTHHLADRGGWGMGFIYSEDFLFIVPGPGVFTYFAGSPYGTCSGKPPTQSCNGPYDYSWQSPSVFTCPEVLDQIQ